MFPRSWTASPRARRTHDATSRTWRPPASTSPCSRRLSCRGRLGPHGATGASGDARMSSAMPSQMRATPPSASYARSASPAHALTRAAARAGRRSPRRHLLPRPLSRPPRGELPPPPGLAVPSTLPKGRVRDQRRAHPPISDFWRGLLCGKSFPSSRKHHDWRLANDRLYTLRKVCDRPPTPMQRRTGPPLHPRRSVVGSRPAPALVAMLAPVDVAALRQLAALRPTARRHLGPREARLHDPHLRAAFAIWSLESASQHLQPCQRCGLCTASWCEACEPALVQGLPPVATCTACDADHLVCAGCEKKGSTWDAARAAYQLLHPEEFSAEASGIRATAVAAQDGAVSRVATAEAAGHG